MDLSERQIEDLTDLYEGALLVHQRSEDGWYVYAEGMSADQVEAHDAELYLSQGWVERQSFESSVNLELYGLTEAGQAVIEPYLEEEGGDAGEVDGLTPHLLLPVALPEDETYLLAVPVSPFDVEIMRRRSVLAETLVAADDAFIALEYEAELSVLEPSRHKELSELLPEGDAYALVSALPEAWQGEAGLEAEWASVRVGAEGFSFAVGLVDGRRLETDELTEEDLMAVAMTLLRESEDGPEVTA